MRRRSLLLAAAVRLAPLSLFAAQKKPQRKPDLQLLKIDSARQEGNIIFEGAIKVTGEKPLLGLVMHFQFFESGGDLLTIQSIQIQDSAVSPGEEKHFQVQGHDVPRAVKFTVSASDAGGKVLTLAGTGPYPLD